jgi:hypothetical protein
MGLGRIENLPHSLALQGFGPYIPAMNSIPRVATSLVLLFSLLLTPVLPVLADENVPWLY